MPRNNGKAKKELINAWLKYSPDNETEKKKIDHFDKEYNSRAAFYWYSKEIFLYRTLNAALRQHDIDGILAMRFLIIDLINQLTDEHHKTLTEKLHETDKLILYRGQIIFENELNLIRNSKDEYLSFNSFLSTSESKEVALCFVGQSNPISSQYILYEITIDTRMKATPFAIMKEKSHFDYEEETIISAGAIFRIGEVVYDNTENRWIGKLQLCSDDDYELNEILKFEGDKIILDDVDALGWIFYEQGEHDRAKSFFQNLLEELLIQNAEPDHIANCYRGLGFVLRELSKYDEALENHEEELKIRVKIDPTRRGINIATTYMALAVVYKWNKRYSKAFKYVKGAYEIIPRPHKDLSELYSIAADIYQEKKQLDLAAKYYQKSLDLAKIYFPPNHFEIGVIYKNIGVLYRKLGAYSEALYFYEKARDVWLKSSVKKHQNFRELEEAIEATIKASINKQFEQYDSKRMS